MTFKLKILLSMILFVSISCGVVNLYLSILSIHNKDNLYTVKNRLKSYTYDEVSLLARVINAEATGCSDVDKVAIASSIMNRVDDPSFNGNIHAVVYSKNQYAINNNFTNQDLNIAYCVYNGWVRDCNVLYFHTKLSSNNHSKKIRRERKLLFKTDCHEYF